MSILVATGVDQCGYREILGAAEGMKEDCESWKNFFIWLKERGLSGVKLIVGGRDLGMLETIAEVFPEAGYQRCEVIFYRNVCLCDPKRKDQRSIQNAHGDPRLGESGICQDKGVPG